MNRTPLRSLLAANAISTAGTAMTLLAVPWFVLVTTHSAAKTGIVGAAETVPLVLAAALGGPAIDRIGARRVAVLSDVLSGLGIALIPALHAMHDLRFWTLCGAVGLVGLTRAPGDTARSVLVPKLVELAETPLERATSAFDGVARGARMLGAPVAGGLIAAFGPADVMLLDAASFLISAFLVSTLPFARASEAVSTEPYLQQLRGGIAGLRQDRLLSGLVAMVLVTNLLDAGWAEVLMPVYARTVLHSAVSLGVLFATFGAGALTGTVIYGSIGPRLPRRPVYTAAFLIVGAPRFGLFAVHLPYAAVLTGMLLCGVACGAVNPILGAVEYERVPAELQSRVMGAMTAGCYAGMPLGALLAGFAVHTLGLTGAIILTGALYTLAGLAPVVFPVWRELDAGRSWRGSLRGNEDRQVDLDAVADLEGTHHLRVGLDAELALRHE